MRMASHHLVVNGGDYVVDTKLAAFLRHLRVEDDLKEKIAELVAQFRGVAFACFFYRFKGFVRLSEQHRRERGVCLFAVPGTAVWRAEAFHQIYEIVERCGHGSSLCYHQAKFTIRVMSNDQPTFKVTDRRPFNPDGSPRDLPPEERPEVKPEPVTAPAEATTGAAAAAAGEPEAAATPPPAAMPGHLEEEFTEEELADARDPAGFLSFIMSIASNAASALGMMEHPVTHQREVDVELGKHWIDVLGMLQKKTQGNLTSKEQQMLEGLLADLRMQYVSLINAPPKAQRFSGGDITGGR